MNIAGFIVTNIWTKWGFKQSWSFTLLKSVTNNFTKHVYAGERRHWNGGVVDVIVETC